MSRRLETILGILTTMVGGIVYLLFRPRVLLLFAVVDGVGLGKSLDACRERVSHMQLPEFVVYSLPSALWVISYLLFMDALFRHQPFGERLVWASIIPVVGIVSELLQGMHLLPGTFDWTDLLCYAVPLILYYILLMHNS